MDNVNFLFVDKACYFTHKNEVVPVEMRIGHRADGLAVNIVAVDDLGNQWHCDIYGVPRVAGFPRLSVME